ncbi:MAG: hypothetical protein QOE82_2272, partial [Thermoanaerobaculia bacterium]|nr:hypothetical protein [Thermoanaerobaculia bacterium]
MIALLLLGIFLPSALLAAAVRRWIAPLPWWIALLFLVMTLAFLHGAVFTSKLPVPVDEVARGYPWRGVFGDVQVRNDLTNDTVKLFLPWMQVAREELAHGRAPLWNRYAFSGYPLLANGESAPFSPLFLATLMVPLPKQIVAMAALKIFAALLFTYLFLKREGASDAAAIFAAVVFAFSTVMTVFLYYSTASVVAFLPAAAFAVLQAMEKGTKASIVLVALVVATLLANGHPESVLHVAIGCGGLLIVEWLRGLAVTRSRSALPRDHATARLRYLLIAVASGLAISAPTWVPVLEQVLISERMAALRSMPHLTMPPTAAWAIISPNGFGNPLRHNWSWMFNYAGVAASYAGLLPVTLFLAAAISRRTAARDRILIVLTALLFLVAMDWTLIGHAFNAVPPFNIVANDKLRFVSIFLLAVVAAKMIDIRGVALYLSASIITILALYVYAARANLMHPIDLLGIALIIIFLFLPQRFRAWGAVVLVTIELFAFNAGFNALVDGKYFRPPLPIIDALRANAPREPFRIAGMGWTLLPNAAAQYGLEDVRGSDPMAFADYDRYLQRFTSAGAGSWVRLIPDANRPELNFLNVRFLFAEPGEEPGGIWRLIYRGAEGTLWENPAVIPRFHPQMTQMNADGERAEHLRTSAPSADQVLNLRNTAPGEFTMTVKSLRGGLIESSEPLGPGRVVYVRGRRAKIRHIENTFI